MKELLVRLSEPQFKKLVALAGRLGLSRTETIRRILDEHFGTPHDQEEKQS